MCEDSAFALFVTAFAAEIVPFLAILQEAIKSYHAAWPDADDSGQTMRSKRSGAPGARKREQSKPGAVSDLPPAESNNDGPATESESDEQAEAPMAYTQEEVGWSEEEEEARAAEPQTITFSV